MNMNMHKLLPIVCAIYPIHKTPNRKHVKNVSVQKYLSQMKEKTTAAKKKTPK